MQARILWCDEKTEVCPCRPGSGSGCGQCGRDDRSGHFRLEMAAKQRVNDVICRINEAIWRKKLRHTGQIVTHGDQGDFVVMMAANLAEADVGHKGIAKALAADGLFEFAALGDKAGGRLGGTTIPNRTVFGAVGLAK